MIKSIIKESRDLEKQLLPFVYKKSDSIWFGYNEEYVKRKHNRLSEGLITSLNQDEVEAYIEKRFGGSKNLSNVRIDYDTVGQALTIVCWYVARHDNNDVGNSIIKELTILKDILRFLKIAGWYNIGSQIQGMKNKNIDECIKIIEEYISSNTDEESEEDFYINIVLEPKYNEEYIYDLLPDTVYHLSPEKYQSKIKKIGLKPTSKKKMYKHLDRIYLYVPAEENVKNSLYDFGYQLAEFSDNDIEGMNVYSIQKTSLKGKKLYYDPIFKRGIYITSNISPEDIELEFTIEIGDY